MGFSAAVVIYPGSNCDRDVISAIAQVTGTEPLKIWHGDTALPKVDLVVLPGGFSYGDYLRCGAMAARSPIMAEVSKHADNGGLLLGICNGFQILTEAGLLPGVLRPNAGLHFICRETFLRVETASTPFTGGYTKGQVVNFPIAHHDGNYFTTADQLKALEDNDQVAFRYATESGQVTRDANPNGAMANIAGIVNTRRNVLGMMPHPERHVDALTGGTDGRALFTFISQSVKALA